MQSKVTKWKKIMDTTPEDYTGQVELWGGEVDTCAPFSIQLDRQKNEFRFNPKDGTNGSYSPWQLVLNIDWIFNQNISEFNWDYEAGKPIKND